MAGEIEAIGALVGGLLGGSGGTRSPYSIGTSSSFGAGGSSGIEQSQSYTLQRPDQVWGAQAPFFQNLWGQGAGLLASGAGQQAGQEIFDQGQAGYNTIMNPGSNPLLDIYGEDLNRVFNQQIMPEIGRGAVGAGMFGQTRQGVAEGLAGGEMARQLASFGGRQYQADMDRMLGALGQTSMLGGFGMGIPWQGLNQMAGLLGQPVVLGQGGYSTSSSSGRTSSFEQSGSESFDISGPKSGFVEPYLPPAPGSAAGPGVSQPSRPGRFSQR